MSLNGKLTLRILCDSIQMVLRVLGLSNHQMRDLNTKRVDRFWKGNRCSHFSHRKPEHCGCNCAHPFLHCALCARITCLFSFTSLLASGSCQALTTAITVNQRWQEMEGWTFGTKDPMLELLLLWHFASVASLFQNDRMTRGI